MTITKEFRIPLPLTVEEYQVAQLYTVIEASKDETRDDSGVEILVNEPYEDPESRVRGQYTHKIYHLGGRVPRVVAAIAPASAMKLDERAWNCYPYCKTVLSNQWLGERFSIIIETWHLPDDGSTENAGNLTAEQLRRRAVHYMDIGADQLTDKEFFLKKDPASFKSEKTGRGPLQPGWKAFCSHSTD